MKFVGIISASLVAAESSPVPFEFDSSEFFGPSKFVSKLPKADAVEAQNCCKTLKVWGDIALFSGRFDQVTGDHAHPDYVASTGDLNLYFHPHFNRWVVSNQIAYGKDTEIRAFGDGSGACPDQQNWRVWNGESFEQPDLVEPWSPYVAAERMFECRPDSFQMADLISSLKSKICTMMNHSTNPAVKRKNLSNWFSLTGKARATTG